MTTVTIYQAVHTGQFIGTGAGSYLFERKVDMSFLPPEGAMVYISTRDGEDGVANFVKRNYWSYDGTTHVELIPFHVDPDEKMQPHCDGVYRRGWWSDRNGDLLELLGANGWTEFGG